MAQSFNPFASRNIIFLTDGAPTFGQTFPDSIVTQSERNNKEQVRLVSFGVGETVNRSLLTELSINNYGYATFITADDSIEQFITNHFKRISKPVMTGLKLDFAGLQVIDVYPKQHLDLYWGSQVLETGRYNGAGDFNVKLKGWVGTDSVTYNRLFTFSDTSHSYRFVPRLWARSKIDYLLNQIEIYGEIEELVNQVIELSLTYQILTPYTALYVDPTAIDKPKDRIVPGAFKLYANYPNPFNPSTTIKYSLPGRQALYKVKIKIYNSLGQLVKVLLNANQAPGLYTIKWNAGNIPSGLYFCVIEAGPFRASQKMLLVK
jgi:Secretion system C-terminal sorting domain